MSEETTKKTFQNLLEYLEVNKRKTAVYFDTINFPKFKAAFSALTIALPEWKNNPSTYLAELLITLSAQQPAAPAQTEADNKQLIADIENAHREAIKQLNEAHGKQVEELKQHLEGAKKLSSEISGRYKMLQTENDKLKTDLDNLTTTATDLQQEIEELSKQVPTAETKQRIVALSERYLHPIVFSKELDKILP